VTLFGSRQHPDWFQASNGRWWPREDPMNTNGAGGRDLFQSLATEASYRVGSKWAFSAALLLILGWALLGPYFHYSDTWQLVINTATTIITFLMVFLIQNTQNRDARAIHLKLDEIICSITLAHNDMIDIEKLSDQELEELGKRFETIRAEFESRKQRNRRPGNS
jgi:low affinity Fe/Cu permease